MQARMTVGKEIENIPVTLAITMPLKEWRQVQKLLKDEYPAWALSSLISDATIALLKANDVLINEGEELTA